MQTKHRRWKISKVESPHELAAWIATRAFTLSTGFALDNYLLLNDSFVRHEAVFAVCAQKVMYSWMDFQPVHQVATIDFTNADFAECLEELSYLGSHAWWPARGYIEEIPFDRLIF